MPENPFAPGQMPSQTAYCSINGRSRPYCGAQEFDLLQVRRRVALCLQLGDARFDR